MGRSERQVHRLLAAYQAGGPAALVHGNRGRRPAHALSDEVRGRVVALVQGKCAGFNDQHLTKKLAQPEEALPLGRSTVRRLLRAPGLPSPRTAAAEVSPAAGADTAGRDAAAGR